MRAIVMAAPGSPDVLQCQAVPIPELTQDTQIRVRLKAAGVNPVDTKIRQRGAYYPSGLPLVLGSDGAGIVDAVGAAVRHVSVGDAVYFCNGGLGGTIGTYADYTVVDAHWVAPKPKTLSFAEAAAAPLVLITAWEALYDRLHITSGQRILIHAGAGGVGHVAIQLAKLRGAQVCTTVSSEAKANFVGRLGVDHCIYYPRIDFVEAVGHWTQQQGVDTAFDTVGEPTLSRTFAAVRIYGDVVTLHAPTAETDWKTARDRNLRLSYELMLTPMLQSITHARQHQAKILARCAAWLDMGQLTIHLAQTLPLEQAATAHRLVESGSIIGKVALVMD